MVARKDLACSCTFRAVVAHRRRLVTEKCRAFKEQGEPLEADVRAAIPAYWSPSATEGM